mmetsp:Transcript_2949/g.4074  ORF Transcript_2949/g.4074 Transcript_2949/m.4074 type:complete len:1084 (+) Transcript_2949:39-3290(+)
MDFDERFKATILDFSKELDVQFLDHVIEQFYNGNMKMQARLVEFQDHPHAWTRVETIMEKSGAIQTKIVSLNILQKCVKENWNKLPQEQRDGIKNFVMNKIIAMSETRQTGPAATMLLKLNEVLVAIVKHDWPHRWPNFIVDLVHSSRKSECFCANNMAILRLLSEEVFEYSLGQMTQDKIKSMKQSLNTEFSLISELCNFILENSTDAHLLMTTLETLLRFLKWIPVGYIFETKLIDSLAGKFFPLAQFQNATLSCLTEIGSLSMKDRPQYDEKLANLYNAIMGQVEKLVANTDIPAVFAQGDPVATEFVRNLSLFLSGFLKAHLNLLEKDSTKNQLLFGLTLLLRISQVDDSVVFKICLEYWNHLVADLYSTQKNQMPRQTLMVSHQNQQLCPRVQEYYAAVLSNLRKVMISKMAKPEEVLIVEDENGQIIREPMKDTDGIMLYKNMRECVIYLTHLDPNDIQNIMLTKLYKQVDGSEWSWHNLNTLCWAIGSISGALSEMQEKAFLVRVIKELLGLCEMKRGKEHKAVIASNIMYVVGQYPRFLRQHWKFLKTVVKKLFEFMHEKFEGVQDMSCDTFLKIAKTCRRKFVLTQIGEQHPFIEELLHDLPSIINDLEQSQIHTFYEAVGEIIHSQNDPEQRQALVLKLMVLPNDSWSKIINEANAWENVPQNHSEQQQLGKELHPNHPLMSKENIKAIMMVLKTNARVASSLKHGYTVQFGRIYLEMLHVYGRYSGHLSAMIHKHGPEVIKHVNHKSMRAVKKETLKLMQTFVKNCQDSDKEVICKQFLPALIGPVLDDYAQNVPDARDSEVLSLFATLVARLGPLILECIQRIFESTFQCTQDMINKNFSDFPDHRVAFFGLIREINIHCFPALCQLTLPQFGLVMESVARATKHLERNTQELGLTILSELLRNVDQSSFINDFFKAFLPFLLKEIFGVLTDTFHKSGFRLQTAVLAQLFNSIEAGKITVPLWSQGQFNNNKHYVEEFLLNQLKESSLSPEQSRRFVQGLFVFHSDSQQFKNHLRDFLVQLKGYDSDPHEEEQKRKQEEMQKQQQQQHMNSVPGLLYTGPSSGIEPKELMD